MAKMEQRYATCPEMIPGMPTAELRERYLITGLFTPDEISATYSHHDRVVILGIMPSSTEITLPTYPEIRSEFFCAHRELGVVNVGESGKVSVDGTVYPMVHGACLYITRGAQDIRFSSDNNAAPAKFYGFSAPAHCAYQTTLVNPGEGNIRELGDPVTSNRRTLNQYIHENGVKSAQIVMGVTTLHAGSMWNTMPAHTHDRRMEAYLYFDIPEEARVVHLMGAPNETRHLIVAGDQAIISPSWSVHCGMATQAYSFVWAMAGENQSFDDMDSVPITDML